MRLHKTGHAIADTVSDLIGELPDGDYRICYGILRHNEFKDGNWFEIDKGFFGSGHYEGTYRISFRGTQPKYNPTGLRKAHGHALKPWQHNSGPALICPPTSHVCEFFGIDPTSWLLNAIRQINGPYIIRHKGDSQSVDWTKISQVITFNSTIGVEALINGIPVISDPIHSTIGSYTVDIKNLDQLNRDELLSFMAAHQFKLSDKESIWNLIAYYLSSSGTIAEKQFAQMSSPIPY